jgi:hypothetical protein
MIESQEATWSDAAHSSSRALLAAGEQFHESSSASMRGLCPSMHSAVATEPTDEPLSAFALQDARRLQSSFASLHDAGSGAVDTGGTGHAAAVTVVVPTSRSTLRAHPSSTHALAIAT